MKQKLLLSLCLLFLLGFKKITAQEESIFLLNPSDPTQLYSFAEVAGGLFYDNEDEGGDGLSWQTGLNMSLAHKFFRINAKIPFTNDSWSSSLLGDIELGLDMVAHRSNNGLYRSSMFSFNSVFPSSNDGTIIVPSSSGLWEISGAYTGAIQLSSKWSVYPNLSFFLKRGVEDRISEFIANPNIFDPWKLEGLESRGLRLALNFAYRNSPRSFVQFRPSWEINNWSSDEQEAAQILEYYNSNQRGLGFKFHYQYAVSPSFQPSLRVDIMDRATSFRTYTYRFQVFLGFTYYI